MSIAVYLILVTIAFRMQYKITQPKIFHRSIGIDIDDTGLESTWYRIEKKIIEIAHPYHRLHLKLYTILNHNLADQIV